MVLFVSAFKGIGCTVAVVLSSVGAPVGSVPVEVAAFVSLLLVSAFNGIGCAVVVVLSLVGAIVGSVVG